MIDLRGRLCDPRAVMRKLAFATLILAASACGEWHPPTIHPATPIPPYPDALVKKKGPASGDESAFGALSDRILDQWLADDPSFGRNLGLHAWDGKIADYSPEGLKARVERLKKQRADLAAVDKSKLTADEALDHAILLGQTDLFLFRLDELSDPKKRPQFYDELFGVNAYLDRDYAPIEDRVKALLTHEEAALKQVKYVLSNLERPLSKPIVETAIKVYKGYAEYLRGDVAKLTKGVGTQEFQAKLIQTNNALAAEADKIVDHLKKDELPKADNKTHILGPDRFKKLIKVQEGLDVPLAEVNKLASLIPANPGKPTSLADARKDVKELAEALRQNELYRRLFDLGERLEGVSRHAGVHAAGVLIAPQPLVEFLPLYRNNNDEITTQYEMKSVDRMGLLKMDFLGLITLTILDDAAKLVEKKTGCRPDLSSIPLNDPEVYRLFAEGRTDGVFQFESSGMRDLLRRVQPTVFTDLSALNALYRPGALDAGTVEVYIERRRGKKFDYPLPQLEPILADTYGVLVYQEQVMLAAQAVAGYSPGEADKLRKAIGKKDDALLKAEGDKFLKKSVAAGTPKKKAEELWALILPFGRYGFNKSHSVVYALLAYQTAWMKVHHPIEFMAATLTANAGRSDDVVKYVSSCRDMRIKILPPDVNLSDLSFTPADEAIRFGLGAVKGVGAGAVNSILQARAECGPFRSLTDFCRRVDMRLNNRKVVEALIRAGAFDFLGRTRATLEAGLESAMESAASARRAESSLQDSLFGDELVESDGSDSFPDLPEWHADEKIRHEKETLGFYITGHPLARFEEEVRLFGTVTAEAASEKVDQSVRLVGLVSSIKKNQIKKGQNEGKTMAKVVLEDLTGTVPLTVFASLYEKISTWFGPGRAVLVTGTVRSATAPGAGEPMEGETAGPIEIIARDIQMLEGLREASAREVVLFAQVPETLDDTFGSVRELLENAPGTVPVKFRLRRAGQFEADIRVSPRLAVRPTPELTDGLERLLGPHAVRYLYSQPSVLTA